MSIPRAGKFTAAAILVLAGAGLASPACAAAPQGDRLARLDARVATLERQVRALEARVDTDTLAAPYANAKWVQPANWERLRIGMTRQQVQDLLGPPMVNNGERWDWAIQGYGGADVVFSGNVIQTWQAPPFYSRKFVREIHGYEK